MVAVTPKTRTISNGQPNNATPVDDSFADLYTNDQTLANAINEIDTEDHAFTGVKTFNNGIKTDTISEKTTNAGVTVDGLTIKDGNLFKYRIGCLEMVAYPESLLLPANPNSSLFVCNGQAISRTTYADLFAVIGTTWGIGDGTTTFNVPDLRGAFPLGKDNMGGSAAGKVTSTSLDGGNATILGGHGGHQTCSLTGEQNGPHTHGLSFNFSGEEVEGGGNSYSTTSANGVTLSSGLGSPHNNMPPWVAINYAIVAR